MSEIFNLNRFIPLLKKTLFERPLQHFGLTFTMFALVLLLYTTSMNTIGIQPAQFISFFIGLIGGGYFLSANLFGYFNTYAKAASYLTLPVSAFEKWLCNILILLVLFVPIYLLFFRVIDSIMLEIYKNTLDRNANNYLNLLEEASILKFNRIEVIVALKVFWNLSSIMLVGALYFNNMSIIKVALGLATVLLVLIGINHLAASILFEENISTMPYIQLSVVTNNQYRPITMPKDASNAIEFIFSYVLPITLFLVSYIRLKEKEL